MSELDRYIEQTRRIRELSSPRASSLADEDDYRKHLMDNFALIGSYAKENNRILKEHCFPHLDDDRPMDKEVMDILSAFSRKLFDSGAISHTDAVLVYRNAGRLLKEAEASDDDALRVRALNFFIASTYHLSYMRFDSAPTIRYSEQGWNAVKAMAALLEKDRFSNLPSAPREHLLSNTAYYLRLFHCVIFDNKAADTGRSRFVLTSMTDILKRLDDPFYLDLVSDKFDRSLHRLSTLEYIASLTDDNNTAGFSAGDLTRINSYTLELNDLYRDHKADNTYLNAVGMELPLYLCRNAYLAKKTDEETYKQSLRALFDSFEDFDFSEEMPTVVMNTVREYLLLLKDRIPEKEDAAFLNRAYTRLVNYMHRAPKDNLFGYLIADASTILALFVPVPGGIGFEDLCLNTIAALHPPTYIHTLSVAAFARCLTSHLIGRMPSLFLGICDCKTEEEVTARAGDIEDFVYHAALTHDFGKLLVAETIMNYGRDLMDEEMEMIVFHPEAGARILRKHADTAAYTDVALGHHKWYDNSGGYPTSFDMNATPLKNVIAIVTCADCLDAATDAVGRSYKEGKSLDHFLTELRAESGRRYAPWLYPLFEDPEIRREIESLLTTGRDENYRKTYRLLVNHEQETVARK